MDAVASQRFIRDGDGTAEAQWLNWPALGRIPSCGPADLVPRDRRAVVIAPHPDDEVLAAGGLLALLARIGRETLVVAVTDGEASHRGSANWPRARLLDQRPQESALALARLGQAGDMLRLGLPDGGIARRSATLVRRLEEVVRPGDVLISTWRLDGHPDHEATGRAAAKVAAHVGASLIEAPVWAWHWATPNDVRLPWARACRMPLDPDIVERKTSAVLAFQSQLQPDSSTGRPAVLRASTMERAARPFEVFFLP
jgi:LmbE family N-acetylglucosaminyl deacetylase